VSRPPDSNAHERWEGEAAAYALGALEEHEVRSFEEHLSNCPQCQSELGRMHDAVKTLSAAPPRNAAPAELKQRVMSAVREDAGGAVATDPVRSPKPYAPRARISWGRWRAPVLAAAAAAVVALGVVIGVLSSSGGQPTRTYTGIVKAPGASASVRVSNGHARLVFARLPTLPSRLLYEMWLERGKTAPVPAGALFASTTGEVAVPGGVRGVQAVLVTAEPRPSGSLSPTRPPIIVVHLT
jgi:anti-sigma-K factor RskA